MSGLNGSAGSRPAPVVRSEAEWNSIMADFERSGLSRRELAQTDRSCIYGHLVEHNAYK